MWPLTVLFGGPLLCLGAWIWLASERRWSALGISVAAAVATIALGWWAIMQSRASTAGIGIVFLPGIGGVSGLCAAAFGRWVADRRTGPRIAAWIALAASLGIVTLMWKGGVDTIAKNNTRDAQQQAYARALDANRLTIAELLRAHAGDEDAALASEIEAHRADPTFLVPAVETPYVREELLDALAKGGDLGVIQAVARNRRTRPDTLEWIYRHSSYPPLFFLSLASNPRTPVTVLRELAARSHENVGLPSALARNPATPPDALDAIRRD
ncbi:MAG TPA: hypothetical protein VFA59_18650 [Vicinamibacterales bacterium]|nr:hypothetical protein [Vicinamibacterales bacterium]